MKIEVTGEWKKIEDEVTIDAATEYLLSNQSLVPFIFEHSAEEPEDEVGDTVLGIGQQAVYMKGSSTNSLWVHLDTKYSMHNSGTAKYLSIREAGE